jgi:radical SAM protein with 4Fe4S-binding SPASM domain
MYRIVVNESSQICHITPRTTGVEGTISLNAFKLLNGAAPQSQIDREFIGHCKSLGWLTADGQLLGSPKVVKEPVHLTKLQIEVTNQCNLKCRYCFNESEPFSDVVLSPVQLEGLLRQADEMGVITIDFSGGEFFLHKNWRELLRLADELQFQISIHTNGTPLSKNNVEYLKNFKIGLIQVSFDSHNSNVHDEARGQSGSWSRAIAGLRRASNEGFRVSCVLMVHQLNKDHVAEATKWFREEFGFVPFLDRLAPSGREKSEQLALSPSEFYEVVAPHLTSETMVRRVCETPLGMGEKIEPHCGVAHSLMYVTASGELCLCPTMTSRDKNMFAGPNIQSTRLRDAWYHHPLFVGNRNVNCRNVSFCKAGSTCRGGCRSNAYFDTGKIDSPDIVSCNIHKNGGPDFVDFQKIYSQAQ